MKTKWLKTTILVYLIMLLIQCSQIDYPDSSEDLLIQVTDEVRKPETLTEPAIPSQSSSSPTEDLNSPTSILPTKEPEKESIPMNQPTRSPIPSGLEFLIEKAKEDLTHKLSIQTTQINVLDAREVMWSDSSLGCPQPGMVYSQVLTPGYLILLEANNKEYEYHAGKGSDVIYCENPSPPVPGMPGDT